MERTAQPAALAIIRPRRGGHTLSRKRPCVRCHRHPWVTTGLTCGRCGVPVCPRCLVHTDVGIRCPACAGVHRRSAFGVFVSFLFSWLLLLPLWRAIFRPKLLQWGCATVTAVVLILVALGIAATLLEQHLNPAGTTAVQLAHSTAPSASGVIPSSTAQLLASATNTPEPASCSPMPCASYQGLTLYVSSINRDYSPKSLPGATIYVTPGSGFHYVRMEVRLVVTQGRHEVSPVTLHLNDSLGALDADYAFLPGCQTASEHVLAPGGELGPTPVCFEAGGPVAGSLKLSWTPITASGVGQFLIPLPQ